MYFCVFTTKFNYFEPCILKAERLRRRRSGLNCALLRIFSDISLVVRPCPRSLGLINEDVFHISSNFLTKPKSSFLIPQIIPNFLNTLYLVCRFVGPFKIIILIILPLSSSSFFINLVILIIIIWLIIIHIILISCWHKAR